MTFVLQTFVLHTLQLAVSPGFDGERLGRLSSSFVVIPAFQASLITPMPTLTATAPRTPTPGKLEMEAAAMMAAAASTTAAVMILAAATTLVVVMSEGRQTRQGAVACSRPAAGREAGGFVVHAGRPVGSCCTI
jgi:hypothetical protein